jgi:hypothetical protein
VADFVLESIKSGEKGKAKDMEMNSGEGGSPAHAQEEREKQSDECLNSPKRGRADIETEGKSKGDGMG